jgi:3-oxoacyl-[acyl-carrier protein] reductase
LARDEQTVLITGCTSGIGRHLAEALIARGDQVVAAARNLPALTELARSGAWPADRTRLVSLDVRDSDAWEKALDEAIAAFGQIDVLLNVAGSIHPGMTHELPADRVHEQIDVNIKGVVFGTQAAARRMIRQGHGHIINVASLCGLAPIPGVAVYTATKYAVRGFSLAAAQELRPHGVHVTVVCPDAVHTRMLDDQVGHDASAVIFSNPNPLALDDVAKAVLGRTIRRKPLEVFIPRLRGRMARLMDLCPGTLRWIMPMLRRNGMAHLKRIRAEAAKGRKA